MALVHVDLEVVVTGEALIANGTPDALLMKGVELVLVVHVMIFAADIAEGGLADVALVDRLSVSRGQMRSENCCPTEDRPTDVTLVRT